MHVVFVFVQSVYSIVCNLLCEQIIKKKKKKKKKTMLKSVFFSLLGTGEEMWRTVKITKNVP